MMRASRIMRISVFFMVLFLSLLAFVEDSQDCANCELSLISMQSLIGGQCINNTKCTAKDSCSIYFVDTSGWPVGCDDFCVDVDQGCRMCSLAGAVSICIYSPGDSCVRIGAQPCGTLIYRPCKKKFPSGCGCNSSGGSGTGVPCEADKC